jgi:hypothetical protein
MGWSTTNSPTVRLPALTPLPQAQGPYSPAACIWSLRVKAIRITGKQMKISKCPLYQKYIKPECGISTVLSGRKIPRAERRPAVEGISLTEGLFLYDSILTKIITA